MRALFCVALVACSSAGENVGSERSGVGICGPDGHVISDAEIGDRYVACDPEIQSVVVSNGDVAGSVDGDCWHFAVDALRGGGVPLVIQFRDVDHRTLCPELNRE